jgi:hypothetical protein
MFFRKDKALSHAYSEVAISFISSTTKHLQNKEIAMSVKDTIDSNFNCITAIQYKNVLYDAMIDQNLIPINPSTNKPYTNRDTQNLIANKNDDAVELVRSIGKVYQVLRMHLKEYEYPRLYSLSDLSALRKLAINDLRWHQILSEVETYARENNIFGQS